MSVKFLIVENNRSVAQDLQGRLLNFGYEVAGICTSSHEAMQSINSLMPDMIIMNFRLQKGTDGIKTGELVQLKHAIPVIYMTENAGQATLRQAQDTGPFGYIFIPFTDRQIFSTLEIAILRNQFEKKIQESQKWLTGVLNGIADGVVAINDQGQIRYINQVALDLTGWQQSDAIGRAFHEVVQLTDERTSTPIELIRDGQSLNKTDANPAFDAILTTQANKKIPVEVNVTMIAENYSSKSDMVIAFRNTQKQRDTLQEVQRQAERAQALAKSAEQLNSNLELSNVLGTICQLTNNAIKASGTAVFLLDKKKEKYYDVFTVTEVDQLLKYKDNQYKIPSDIVNSLVSFKNQVVVIDDLQGSSNFPYLRLFQKENICRMVIAGIFHHQDLMGVLASIFISTPTQLQNDDLELLKGLADQAALSITNANLFRQVRLGREHQRKLAKSMVDVQEEERRHIARELHDHLGQLLTGLQFLLESAKRQDGNAQKGSLEEIQKTVGDIIGQVREMSLNLRPGMLDDMGLLPTLQWHLERFSKQTGIHVDFQENAVSGRFPADVETSAYRIIQEALTNVARHAQVKQVFVGLITQENVLWIEILDKGKGFDTDGNMTKPTSGLGGMQERASLVGGYVIIRSFIDQGTQIVAALPMDGKPLERRKIDRNYFTGR
ncbi:MAG TPA: histidine kinase [Anaerolineales bacterium]|nr:histidine kinase [Anaerolineales bacterium]